MNVLVVAYFATMNSYGSPLFIYIDTITKADADSLRVGVPMTTIEIELHTVIVIAN